ncbi:MAG: glycerol-3-phosphate dehydrogenase/oxidase, partial [Acidimicrobiales bacterium]
EHGAVIANDVSAVGISKSSDGLADGVEVAVGDRADGERFTIRTRSIVNAGGVWADEVRTLDEGRDPDSIRPAKGVHVTVPWHKVRNQIAAVIPVPKDRRSVFVVPVGRFTYIGTTDTDYDGPVDDPQCTEADVEYLLSAINAASTETITTADVVGTWAGLRPLVKSAEIGRTADLSRRHHIARSGSGVITITGGKLTTYRDMAANAVDEVIEQVLARQIGFAGFAKSATRKLRLRGAAGYDTLAESARAFSEVPPGLVDHLGTRYGGEARALMAAIQSDPTLAEPIVSGLPYTRAEAMFAVRHEMARSVDDLLSRRTRARLLARDDSALAAAEVGALVAAEQGWSADDLDASVEEYRASVRHEREAANLPETHLETLLGA